MRSLVRAAIAVALTLPALATAVTPANGSNTGGIVTTYSTPSLVSTGPNDIAADNVGNLWFTVTGDAKIGRITSSGTVTMFAAPDIDQTLACAPWQIALGPDEAMWFTCLFGGIGRIAADGSTTVYPVPGGASAQPWGIAAGHDGALWFTQPGTDSIGRITTAGAITEYPIGQTGVNLRDITRGPDNKMFFVSYTGPSSGSNPYVGSIDMAGNVQLVMNLGAVGFNGIAWGWDGNLWVTQFGAQSVVVLDPTTISVVTTLATSFANPKAIAAAPNGQMWVTEGDGGSGRIDAFNINGTSNVYATNVTSTLNGIAAAPSGDMWFTAFDTQQVGSVTSGVNPGVDPPTVSGPTFYGAQLTCTTATWASPPNSVDTRWLRNGVDIPQAAGSSNYVITADDVDQVIACQAVARWEQVPVAAPFPSQSVIPTAILPSAPRDVRVSTGINAVTVTWAAPASDGGAPITGYRVTSNTGESCTTTGALTCMVIGLTPGVDYTFTVVAINAIGESVGATSAAAIPYGACGLGVQSRASKRVENRGTTTLISSADAGEGCRLAIRTKATALVRGDVRPAVFKVNERTGRVTVKTRGMRQLLTVTIRSVPTSRYYIASSPFTKTWRVK